MIAKPFEVCVPAAEFDLMVRTLMKVENSGLTVRVRRDRMEAFTLSQDSSSVLVYACIDLLREIPEIEPDGEVELWVKTLDKFKRLLTPHLLARRQEERRIETKCADGSAPEPNRYDEFRFTAKDNYIYHASPLVRGAKFLLGEFPARADVMAKRVGPAWFERFKVVARFPMTLASVGQVLKNGDFAAGVEKAYINLDGQDVVFEVDDKTRTSSDSISMKVSELEWGEIEPNRFIVPMKSLAMLTLDGGSPASFMPACNGNGRGASIVLVEQKTGPLYIKYLVNGKKE